MQPGILTARSRSPRSLCGSNDLRLLPHLHRYSPDTGRNAGERRAFKKRRAPIGSAHSALSRGLPVSQKRNGRGVTESAHRSSHPPQGFVAISDYVNGANYDGIGVLALGRYHTGFLRVDKRLHRVDQSPRPAKLSFLGKTFRFRTGTCRHSAFIMTERARIVCRLAVALFQSTSPRSSRYRATVSIPR